ncbi:MAG TPA: Maf family protein, partial [Candidatus Dietzia merdigallinarum]|nr:Maf family protein [Candidatus Dietzia merdigallinarum]
MISFVLASASPSRLRILEQAGVDPIVRPSRVDEDAV